MKFENTKKVAMHIKKAYKADVIIPYLDEKTSEPFIFYQYSSGDLKVLKTVPYSKTILNPVSEKDFRNKKVEELVFLFESETQINKEPEEVRFFVDDNIFSEIIKTFGILNK